MNKNETIHTMWNTATTTEIARATGLAERTVRWRAGKLGLPPHRRGRRRQAIPAVAAKPDNISAPLPTPDNGKSVARAGLPPDYRPYRPGE
ncbi:hypothetical protein ACFL2T_00250 [Elusimicrobiota bacterium]